ncbi:MAG: tetratricopeptide repeat protein [Nitrospirota bacterium]|nr:tetratricopeptide repeat protein [Nitrospirota bacterium]
MTTLQKISILLLCLGLLAGCGRTRPPQGPPVSGAIPPPAVESVPDRDEEFVPLPLEVPPDIQRIHAQLYQESKEHFDEKAYPQTISGLTRLLALLPEKPIEVESRWLLAQAYRQMGEWEAARDQYRTLAAAGNTNQYQANAQLQFNELQRLLEQFTMPPLDTQAIRLTLKQLPASGGFDEGIKKMKADGITTLLIDLGCEGAGFHTDQQGTSNAPRHLLDLQSLLRSYVERSHRLDLLVYVGVNLRCVGNWHDSPLPEWRDRTYNVTSRQVEDSRFFDLFHPEYQRFLDQFLTHLSEEGVDGLVFLDDYPMGVYDGVSRSGLTRFHTAFGMGFDPVRAFQPGFDPLRASKLSSRSPQGPGAPAEDSVFWRWAGWKARERLTVVEQLIGQLRKRYLTVQCGLELHPHGLTDPVGALVEYAQDAMEAIRRPFSFFFVRPEIDRQSSSDQLSAIEKLRRISTKAVLTRLLPVLDDPRRVWVSMPTERGKRIVPGTAGSSTSLLDEFPSGIGVVHDLRAFS